MLIIDRCHALMHDVSRIHVPTAFNKARITDQEVQPAASSHETRQKCFSLGKSLDFPDRAIDVLMIIKRKQIMCSGTRSQAGTVISRGRMGRYQALLIISSGTEGLCDKIAQGRIDRVIDIKQACRIDRVIDIKQA